jgi:arylformamidase
MKIYDITVGITPDMPVWPGHVPVIVEQFKTLARGDIANISRVAGSAHMGTHVDAPCHFIEGAASLDDMSLEVLTGNAYVSDLQDVRVIDEEVLEKAGIPPDAERILLKTRNSDLWASGVREFRTDYVGLNAKGAQWLVSRGVKLVGSDYLAVAAYDDLVETHRVLLGNEVIIAEGLNLSGVGQGWYKLYCLPLKLAGSDGAPARAILVEEDEA